MAYAVPVAMLSLAKRTWLSVEHAKRHSRLLKRLPAQSVSLTVY
jgi:hypothetical protein